LREQFADWLPGLPADAHRSFLLGLPERGIAGGNSYDALIAATAALAGVKLATCDERARRIYELYEVTIEYL
jgi:predicted nucleic acid-binding protein